MVVPIFGIKQGYLRQMGHSEDSDRTWSTGGGNCKPPQYSYQENLMNTMKRQKGMIQEDEPLMLEGVPYATREELRVITNSCRKNEVAGQKWK